MSEEEYLQSQIESGRGDDSLDSTAYRRVFSALKTDPGNSLSPSFADKVVTGIVKKNSLKNTAWEIGLIVIGVLTAMVTCVIGAVLTEFKLDFGFLKSMNAYKGVFIFGICLIGLLHWIDKTLIQKQRH